MKRSFVLFTMLAVTLLYVSGCAFIEPHTTMTVNPITRTVSFYDSKDNTVELELMAFNPDTKLFELKGLKVSNKSTPVIEANVLQMQAVTEQQQKVNEGILATGTMLAQVMSGATDLMAQAVALRAETNNGTTALMEGMADVLEQLRGLKVDLQQGTVELDTETGQSVEPET